ncbi:MAG: class I SAM-dependent methyltransferase [bacterium]|nr:class I SAM-dependent methyltransferase [bacterium]
MPDAVQQTALTDQYEAYPYPPRDPQAEEQALRMPVLDQLSKINHFCFRGRESFSKGFRALIAGGGTGDAAIYLAEQLRETDAEIVYVDLSSTSLEVAKARARVRGLTNIKWLNASLLDLTDLGVGLFDYINCCGVLHHLAEPKTGLRMLRSCLLPAGSIGLMVYGQYGRIGVYQLQDLLRRIGNETDSMQTRVDLAKAILKDLPAGNLFRQGQERIRFKDLDSDIGIYDLLLHSQDRAYTVPQLYELCSACGMTLAGFVDHRAHYSAGTMIKDPGVRERLRQLPYPEQEALAELLWGSHSKHMFYVSQISDSVADPVDRELAPLLQSNYDFGLPDQIRRLMGNVSTGMNINIRNGGEGAVDLALGEYTSRMIAQMNGRMSLNRIFKKIRKDKAFRAAPPTNEELQNEFLRIYRQLHPIDMILLKDPGIPDFMNTEQLQARMISAVANRKAATAP